MRKRRELGNSNFQHITQRATGQHMLFLDNEDRQFFISLLKKYCPLFGRLLCFALMGNHYHLLVETEASKLSALMHRINTSYAMYFNRKYNRKGALFCGRYGNEPIESEKYLINCIKYILNNPKKAGHQLLKPSSLWTSLKSYFGNKYSFIDKSIIIDKFKSEDNLIKFLDQDTKVDNFIDTEKVKQISDSFVIQQIIKISKRSDFIQASYNIKLKIAKKLRENIPCSIKQLSRVLAINYGLLLRKLKKTLQKIVFTYADLFPDEEWSV